MKYTIDKQDRYTIFQLDEVKLDSIIAPQLKSEFVILSNEGVNNFIFHLSKLYFLVSSGLCAILTGDRLWKRLGTFILTGVDHPEVKKLIEISKLESILTIIPTLEEAIDYAFMEELERELDTEGED